MSEVTSFTVASAGGKILPELIRRSLYWRIGCLINDSAVEVKAETFDSQRMELRYRQVRGRYLLFFFLFFPPDTSI